MYLWTDSNINVWLPRLLKNVPECWKSCLREFQISNFLWGNIPLNAQFNSYFTTIGSNVVNQIGQFVIINKSTDKAACINMSHNGQAMEELFYLMSILW